MTIPINSANVYTDLDGLDKLRLSADKHDPEALKIAAQQFEAIFVQQMLKSMRDASLAEGAFDSDESRFYLDMFDKQISLSMTEGKGIGLADMIIKQLQASMPNTDDETSSNTKQQDTHKIQNVLNNPVVNVSSILGNDLPNQDINFSNPNRFVQQLLPLATNAANQLGVDPKVILAQAALETGWGKYVNKYDDGSSSHNMFNIKADADWAGDSIKVSSIEFDNSIPIKQDSHFRSYENIAESFQDYVNFIKTSPRYEKALQVSESPEQYIRELHNAGYATDPEYSNKIMRILDGVPFNEALSSIKLSLNETITSMDGSQ